ncbi:hypothetical protein WA556_004994, partial [Blastocystis sp. ATCC 50177/Nand II]
GKNSFTLQKAPRIPENVDTLIATEARSFEISFCPVLKSITIGSGSFFEYKTCTLRNLPLLESLQFSPESIDQNAPGYNFLGADSLDLSSLSSLKTCVIGSNCFCYSKMITFDDLPSLKELITGDESLAFCTLLTMRDLDSLKKWILYGSCLFCCLQIDVTSVPSLNTIEEHPGSNPILGQLKTIRINEDVSDRFHHYLNSKKH